MSEETKVNENEKARMSAVAQEATEDIETTAQVAEPLPVEQVGQTTPLKSLDDFKVGYIVALTEDDNFVFDVFGSQKGLLEVMGLHQHATLRVNQIHNQSQMAGDTLINEVGKALSVLNNKLDQLLASTGAKRPDNNL